MEFVECDTCRAKPGSPPLCSGCLRNRETINELNRRLTGKGLTQRGFEDFASFKDSHGNPVTVRESSQMGEPCVWVFCHHEQIVGCHVDTAPHLNAAQARVLAEALIEFARGEEITAKETRENSLDMVRLLRDASATPQRWFLLAQSGVVALQEIAAQLAEANERAVKEDS